VDLFQLQEGIVICEVKHFQQAVDTVEESFLDEMEDVIAGSIPLG
jgi:hypothetical protein